MKDTNSINGKSVVNIKASLIAGFIASIISSIVLMITTSIILIPEFNFISIQGSIFGLAETALSAWIVYFIFGLIWGYLYALIEPNLPKDSIFGKGLIVGILIWIIYMLILMPLAGAGLFLKEYGLRAAAIILVVDLVFGVVTAYFYNRFRK